MWERAEPYQQAARRSRDARAWAFPHSGRQSLAPGTDRKCRRLGYLDTGQAPGAVGGGGFPVLSVGSCLRMRVSSRIT